MRRFQQLDESPGDGQAEADEDGMLTTQDNVRIRVPTSADSGKLANMER